MKKEEKNVPELRFPEFDGEWQGKKLIDFCTLQRGFDLTKSTRVQGEYPVYSSSGISYSHNEYKVEGPGVITGRKGILGKVFFIEGKFWPHDTTLWVKGFHGNSQKFVYYFLLNFKLERHDASTSVPTLNRNNIHGIKILSPSLPEQQKIASFLSAVDQKLEQLARKKKLLEQYKKGVMQKIFSQEIRFKDDNGQDYPDWEEKRLQQYLVKHDEKTLKSNQYPVLTSSRKGIMFQTDYYRGNEVASKDNTGYNVVPRGYFTYRHMSDDLIFKFNINNIADKGIVSTLYPVFTTRNINDSFLTLKLNEGDEFKRYALIQKQGGSRTYMYFSKLEKLEINMPCIEEQQKIADFLSSIDVKITAVQTQLNHTQHFKKGLLQKMFV